MIFSKFSSCIIGPYDNIRLPKISSVSIIVNNKKLHAFITPKEHKLLNLFQCTDWEVELAVVIGKEAKEIRPDQADKYIFGYTIAQDISARDWQLERNGGQYLLGKSMDTFCPIGPAVVTTDTIHDINKLNLTTWVNGKLKQDSNTSDMIFKVDFLVSYLSQ